MSEEKKDEDNTVKVMVIGGLILAVLWVGWFFLSVYYWNAEKEGEWGTVGDSFGTLNALLSAGAVLMAIHAINLQRKDHRIQREANAQNLDEYRETKEAQINIAQIQIVTNEIDLQKFYLARVKEEQEQVNVFLEKYWDVFEYYEGNRENLRTYLGTRHSLVENPNTYTGSKLKRFLRNLDDLELDFEELAYESLAEYQIDKMLQKIIGFKDSMRKCARKHRAALDTLGGELSKLEKNLASIK